jgi:hypothetical protein
MNQQTFKPDESEGFVNRIQPLLELEDNFAQIDYLFQEILNQGDIDSAAVLVQKVFEFGKPELAKEFCFRLWKPLYEKALAEDQYLEAVDCAQEMRRYVIPGAKELILQAIEKGTSWATNCSIHEQPARKGIKIALLKIRKLYLDKKD